MAQSGLHEALENAQKAVMGITTVQADMVRILGYVFTLLDEAQNARDYEYHDLILAFLWKAEHVLRALSRARLCFPEKELTPALRALRDARLLLIEQHPDLPAVETVTLDSVLERLVWEADKNWKQPL
jgi:hypothetical protein